MLVKKNKLVYCPNILFFFSFQFSSNEMRPWKYKKHLSTNILFSFWFGVKIRKHDTCLQYANSSTFCGLIIHWMRRQFDNILPLPLLLRVMFSRKQLQVYFAFQSQQRLANFSIVNHISSWIPNEAKVCDRCNHFGTFVSIFLWISCQRWT